MDLSILLGLYWHIRSILDSCEYMIRFTHTLIFYFQLFRLNCSIDTWNLALSFSFLLKNLLIVLKHHQYYAYHWYIQWLFQSIHLYQTFNTSFWWHLLLYFQLSKICLSFILTLQCLSSSSTTTSYFIDQSAIF